MLPDPLPTSAPVHRPERHKRLHATHAGCVTEIGTSAIGMPFLDSMATPPGVPAHCEVDKEGANDPPLGTGLPKTPLPKGLSSAFANKST